MFSSVIFASILICCLDITSRAGDLRGRRRRRRFRNISLLSRTLELGGTRGLLGQRKGPGLAKILVATIRLFVSPVKTPSRDCMVIR